MKITGWPASVLFVAALLTTGCEPPRYEVSGRISYADGSPFVMARSTIRPDGTFLLAGRNEHEGMLAGRYRLRLIPPRGVGEASIDDPGAPQLPFDRRFLDFETSGLTCEVGPDSSELQIDLGTKPGRN